MSLVYHVAGIAGSGKTYICQELKRRGFQGLCIDLDDVVADAYRQLMSEQRDWNDLVLLQRAQEIIQTAIDEAKERHVSTLVFVGITLPVPQADSVFFIELNSEQLQDAYRRVIVREIDKVVDNADSLRQIAKTAPLERVGPDLSFLFSVNAVPLNQSFEAYESMYQTALGFEISKGVTVLSQRNIILRILFSDQVSQTLQQMQALGI